MSKKDPWRELGKLLKSGGMNDPWFLIGVVRADIDEMRRLRAELKATKKRMWDIGHENERLTATNRKRIRCQARSPGGDSLSGLLPAKGTQCGLDKGHTGQHTVLMPSNAPWWPKK